MVFWVAQVIFLFLSVGASGTLGWIFDCGYVASNSTVIKANSAVIKEAEDHCRYHDCRNGCVYTRVGALDQNFEPHPTQEAMFAALKSTHVYDDENVAFHYARGHFQANCNGQLEVDGNCKTYSKFYICSSLEGCKAARGEI